MAERVADESPVTVVVVRGQGAEHGEIVVGVDGSRSSRCALRWAVEEGRRHHQAVRALLAWSAVVPVGSHGPEPFATAATDADERLILHRIVAEELEPEEADGVLCESVSEDPARALTEGSNGAALLVVGAADSIRLFDVPSGRERGWVPTNGIRSLALSADGGVLAATAEHGAAVYLWRVVALQAR